jgi:hypothetical protein
LSHGKKGQLFSKQGSGRGSSSSSSGVVDGDGLESLQGLIPPEVARARLKVGPDSRQADGV